MVDIDVWLGEFRSMLEGTFGDRIEFIGLQGSYSRGEATDKSDIDVVVVLDKLQIEDLYVYDGLLDTLPFREKLCGFISGKSELLNWEPSDLFHLYFDTKPIKGALDFLLTSSTTRPSTGRFALVPVTSIMRVFIICCMKKILLFKKTCINTPALSSKQSAIREQENLSDPKVRCLTTRIRMKKKSLTFIWR